MALLPKIAFSRNKNHLVVWISSQQKWCLSCACLICLILNSPLLKEFHTIVANAFNWINWNLFSHWFRFFISRVIYCKAMRLGAGFSLASTGVSAEAVYWLDGTKPKMLLFDQERRIKKTHETNTQNLWKITNGTCGGGRERGVWTLYEANNYQFKMCVLFL